LTLPITAYLKQPDFPVSPSKIDFAIENLLLHKSLGDLSASDLSRLMIQLSEASEVWWDQAKVKVERLPHTLEIVFRDQGNHVAAKVELQPKPDSRMATFALTANTLRLVPALPHEVAKVIPWDGALFTPQDFKWLAGEVIPTIERRGIGVKILTNKLPHAVEIRPQIHLAVTKQAHGINVVPKIIYGSPFREAGELVAIRDSKEEARLTAKLHCQFEIDFGTPSFFSTDQAIKFFTKIRTDLDFVVTGASPKDFVIQGKVIPTIQISTANVEISLTINGLALTTRPEAVVKAWQEGESFVPLLEGGFGELDKRWLNEYGQVLTDLLDFKAQHNQAELAPAQWLRVEQILRPMKVELPAQTKEKIAAILDAPQSSALPSDFIGELRSYQRFGHDWLVQRRTNGLGALLADDMGLGKTIQSISIIEPKTLVICPASVLPNWLKEIKRFRPGLKAIGYHGLGRTIDASADVHVTTYGTFRVDEAALTATSWNVVILDEAQNIKNPDSQIAQAVFSLRSKFKLALTGTPLENHLSDIWSQFNFLNPGLLGSYSYFKRRFGQAQTDTSDKQLAHLLSPFILRRLKKEVLTELPPKTEEALYVELSSEEEKIYQAIYHAHKPELVAKIKDQGLNFEVLEILLRLRQACCHPGLLPGRHERGSSKTEVLVQKILEASAENHKSLVFSQWTKFLDLIAERLKEEGIPYLRLDGSTVDRQAVVDMFQADRHPERSEGTHYPVLLMSLKAGGVGLNLTAADHVFIMDPWWNPAAEKQAADRAHRFGQQNPVMVYKLIAQNTIEEKLLLLQEKKLDLAEQLLSGEVEKLDRSALLHLFSDL
jgi:superfamily II DNA or RNA helicase